MKSGFRGGLTFLVTLILLCGWISTASAWTLSGTVYGGSSAFANVQVAMVNTATSTQSYTATDSAGSYAFTSVSDGTYNLTFTPPGGSGFAASAVNGVQVSGGNVTQNVLLLAQLPGTYTISGTVRNADGTLATGYYYCDIYVQDWNTNWWFDSQVDSEGHYSIQATSGTNYTLTFMIDDYVDDVHDTSYSQVIANNFAVTANVTQDITLPALVTLSGRTIDGLGNPIPGAYVRAEGSTYNVNTDQALTMSDDAGNYSVSLLPLGNHSVTVSPPESRLDDLGYKTYPVISVTANTTQDLVLPATVYYTLSGRVQWPVGTTPTGNFLITAYDATAALDPVFGPMPVYTTTVDSQGNYSMTVAPGIYNLSLDRWVSSDPSDHRSFEIPAAANVMVTGNRTQDLPWPTSYTVSGTVKGSNGAPVPGAQVSVTGHVYETGFNEGNWILTDASGNYSFQVLPFDSYAFDVYAPDGPTQYTPQHFAPVSVTANTTRDFSIPYGQPLITLSGTVSWSTGTPAPESQLVTIKSVTNEISQVIVTVDSLGRYSATLPGGNYNVGVWSSWNNQKEVLNLPLFSNLAVTADRTLDLQVPSFVTLSGKTTDKNGAPVPGARVAVNANEQLLGGTGNFFNSAVSDASGNYSFPVFPSGGYIVTVAPPSGTTFATSTLTGVDVSTSKLFNVILNLPTGAPVFKVGPKPTYLSDLTATIYWQTDKPAKGSLSYSTGGGQVVTLTETDFATNHSMALQGLKASTTYNITVTATDAAGNPPTTGSASIITLAQPNTNPPETFLPYANVLDGTSALIYWSTDRMTMSGSVVYGRPGLYSNTVAESGTGTFHSVKLTGLTPLTQYFYTVTSTDPATGSKTGSGVYYFTTPAAGDTVPPVIDGPMANSINDTSATIVWTTDEAATSGVSWNVNGTNYGLIQDPTLTTNHSVTVTGLSAGTSYNFTVSSIDASNNGPTLKTGTFTTRSTADTAAPVFTLAPVANSTTDTSAIISWSTDKGASCDVKYGTSAALLNQTDSSVPGLFTKQNRTLVNLTPGTTYYFQVVATDLNGKVGTSASASFTTATRPDNVAPIITSAAAVAYTSNNIAVVTFATDKACSAVARYGTNPLQLTSQAVDPNGMVTNHQISLTNLSANTTYSVQVGCTDVNGLTVVASAGHALSFLADSGTVSASDVNPLPAASFGFTTQALPDTTLPAITTAPAATGITAATAMITWKTDKLSDSQVYYGVSGQNTPLFAGDLVKVTNHAVTLTNLTPGTNYEFRVQSTDPSSNTVVSSVYTFRTAAAVDTTAPVISSVSASGATISRIHVTWSTDEPATTQVNYGTTPTSLSQQAVVTGLSTAHDVTLYNLVPGTTYYLAPVSADSSNNSSQGATRSVTLAGTAPTIHLVTATAGAGGSVTPVSQTVYDGYQLSLAVVPNAGYQVNSITGCGGTLTGNAYTTAAVTADCQVSATFSADPSYNTPTALTTKALPTGGTYAGGTVLQVQLQASRPATIYYTTDGSTPTTSSRVYATPITINGSSTIKYFAKDSTSTEPVESATYTYSASAKVAGSYSGIKSGSSFTVLRAEAGKTFGAVASNVASTTFTDTSALKPNTVYQYAVTSDSDPTQTVFMTIRTPMYNGWNIVAVPYQTSGVAASSFFASPVSTVYQWVPTGATTEASTVQLGSYQPVTTLDPGNGYFVKTSNGSTMVAYSGTPGPVKATVTLKPGWTMIANPTTSNKTNIANSWLIDGAALSAAINANKVGGGLYWWNGTTYDSWSIIGDNPQVEPWKGYWIINLDASDHTLTIQ